jgi:hypothetical protein
MPGDVAILRGGESSPKFVSRRGGIARKIARQDFTKTVGTLFCWVFSFFTDRK